MHKIAQVLAPPNTALDPVDLTDDTVMEMDTITPAESAGDGFLPVTARKKKSSIIHAINKQLNPMAGRRQGGGMRMMIRN